MNKIAVSSQGPTLDDLVDSRFGRACGFVVVDPEGNEPIYLENGAACAMGQGAGIAAAELVANAGATIVLTGYVGPKAFTALKAAGISVGQDLQELTVGQAIKRYQDGQVEVAQAPNRAAGGR